MSKVNLIYTGSNGREFNLMAEDIRLRAGSFFRAKWKPDTNKKQFGVSISRWTKEPLQYEMELIFSGSVEERKQMLTSFWSSTETDILTGIPGVLTYQNAYLEGFFIESDTEPTENQRWTAHTVIFYAPVPFWVTEQKIIVNPLSDDSSSLSYKTYDGGYSYDTGYHYPGAASDVVVNTGHYTESDFRLAVYGPTSNVAITMAGNLYQVNHAVGAGEIMIIDSRQSQPIDRKCYLIGSGGTITNIFNSRIGTLFNKLPGGEWQIVYTREYSIELTIYKRRSVPFWS